MGQITNDGFRLNGSALQIDSVCYQLTPEDFGQVGTMWNIDQINLYESFQILVEVSFGCIDANGADGIAFVLQPLSTTQGSNGEGLGFAMLRHLWALNLILGKTLISLIRWKIM